MRAKCFALLLAALLLAGCSLARPEEAVQGPDRLVGAVITTEYLETDSEPVIKNGTVVFQEERIEGTPIYVEGTDRLKTVEFPHVKGYTLLLYEETRNGECYTSNLADEEFYDLGIHSSVTDEGESRTISGTLMVDVAHKDMVHFYTNGIYVRPDGGFYLTPGTGISTNCEDGQEFSMSQSLEDTYTETVNGKSSSSGSRVEVTFRGGFPGEEFTLVQLNGENDVVKKESWKAENLPESVELEKETELAVLETHYTNRQGKVCTDAETISSGQLLLNEENGSSEYVARLYLPGEDGVCRVQTMILRQE